MTDPYYTRTQQCPGERAPASFVEECAGQWAARTGQPAPVMAALHYLSARTAKHAPCVERLASGDWHWIADSEELVRDRSRAWEEQEKPKPVPKNETRRLFQDEVRTRQSFAIVDLSWLPDRQCPAVFSAA